ncbi:hypothetical protein I317_00334 [Kwoniella heveanensis CBS 569]|nr:hypothetical protein I317_00334 [Kwoniella heveanensis CBS 569]
MSESKDKILLVSPILTYSLRRQSSYGDAGDALIKKRFIQFPLSPNDLETWENVFDRANSKIPYGTIGMLVPLPSGSSSFTKDSSTDTHLESLRARIKREIISEVDIKYQRLNDRITEVEENVTGLSASFERIQSTIERLEAKSEAVNINASTISSSVDVDSDTDLVIFPANGFHSQTDRSSPPHVSQDHQAFTTRVESLAQKLQILAPALHRLDAKVDRLDIKMDRTDIKVGALADEVEKHKSQLREQEPRIDDLKQTTEDMQGRLLALESKEDGADEKALDLDTLKQKVEDLQGAVGNKAENASLEKQGDLLKAFIDQTQIRAINRALLDTGRWAHPVPSLQGKLAPEWLDPPPEDKWALCLPWKVQTLDTETLNAWLDHYDMGERKHEFMRDVPIKVKRSILYNAIWGSLRA